MNQRPQDPQPDPLKQRLRQSLAAARPADSEALQDRVLVQWHQRHPASETALASAGPGALLRRPASRWALAGLALAVVLTAGWLNRPDPVLEELMQPDVLSQIGLGEL